MNKILVFFLLPALLNAGNIDLSLKYHSGYAYYTVESTDIQNLKSKLVFPFRYKTFDIKYEYPFKIFNISLYTSFLIDSKTTKGEDFDWKNKNLTVYSNSDDLIDKYNSVSLKLDKQIFKNFSFFAKVDYKKLNSCWKNTSQTDFISHTKEHVNKNSLIFKQKFYMYNFGINYKKNVFEKLSFEFNPSLVYSCVDTKDIHILRNFYTTQNIRTFSYKFNFKLNYYINRKSKIKVSFSHLRIKDDNINMDYYNLLNEKYLSYPSSYIYRNNIIGIHYEYYF